MTDGNNTNERVEISDRVVQSDDMVTRLERKILELEEEVSTMRNLAKLSISFGTPFWENMDNQDTTNLATPPIHPPPIQPTSQMQSNLANMTNTLFPNYQNTFPSEPALYPPNHVHN